MAREGALFVSSPRTDRSTEWGLSTRYSPPEYVGRTCTSVLYARIRPLVLGAGRSGLSWCGRENVGVSIGMADQCERIVSQYCIAPYADIVTTVLLQKIAGEVNR